MGKTFAEEMIQLPAAMQWAAEQPVDLLRRAIDLFSDRGLIAIGSGGSFTAAALAADLHMRVFARPSQAITPLETFLLPTADSGQAAGLLRAERVQNFV